MSQNPTSRRSFLKASTLTASALALRGPALLAQSAQADAHIEILPGEAIGTISPEIYSPLHRAARRRDLRRRLGRRRLQNPQRQWHPQGLHRHDARRAGSRPALARRLLCRQLRLARRHRPSPPNVPRAPASGTSRTRTHYGLHEFMHTCRAIGCKPYLAADLRITACPRLLPGDRVLQRPRRRCAFELRRQGRSPNALAAQRAANGDLHALQRRPLGRRQRELGLRRQPDARGVRRRVPPLHGLDAELQQEPLRFVAVGPNGDDVDWTTRLFKALYANPERRHLWGLSVHYYTSGSPSQVRRRRRSAVQRATTTTICSPAAASWSASSPTTGQAMRQHRGPATGEARRRRVGRLVRQGHRACARVQPLAAVHHARCPADRHHASTSSSATPTRSPSPPSRSRSTASTR